MRHARIAIPMMLVLALVTVAPAAEPLADRLPGDALVYVGWAGRTKALDESMMGRLLQEPGLAKAFGLIRQAIAQKAAGGGPEAQQMVDNGWELAQIVCRHPAAVALTGLEVNRGEPVPSLAVLIDLGADRAEFAKRLDQILSTTGIPLEDAPAGDLKYKAMPTPLGPLAMGYLGDVFFLCLGQDLPQRLSAMTAAKALSANKDFADAMKAVGGQNVQGCFYVDTASLMRKLAPLADAGLSGPSGKGPKFAQVMDSLGLGKLTAVAGGLRVADGYLNTRLRLVSPAPHRGALMPLAGEPLTEADLAALPEDTEFLAAWKVSAEGLYTEIRRIIKDLDPDMDADINKELANPQSLLAGLFLKDVTGSLGQTWIISGAPSYGGMFTGTLLSVEVKDEAKLSGAIAKLEAMLKTATSAPAAREDSPYGRIRRDVEPALRVARRGDVEVHYVGFSGQPIPVAPAWAVYKGRLYVAGWPQVIFSAIENQGKTSLVKSPDFAQLRARLGGNPSMITYLNTPRLLRQNYNLVLVFWTMFAASLSGELGLAIAPDWLPPLSALEKYIRPEMGAVWSDKDGITVEGYGTVPGLSAAPMTPALGVAVLMPALAQARLKARKTVSASNLSNIGKGVAMYSAANQDEMPPDFDALIADGQAPGLFVSPLSGRPVPKVVNKKLVGEVDYIYIHLPSIADPLCVMAYERPENYQNKGTWVLYADIHVAWVDMKTFEEQLKTTQDYLKDNPPKKAGAKAKGEDF